MRKTTLKGRSEIQQSTSVMTSTESESEREGERERGGKMENEIEKECRAEIAEIIFNYTNNSVYTYIDTYIYIKCIMQWSSQYIVDTCCIYLYIIQ